MKINSLSFLNYRNLQDTKLSFSENVNFISGKNGQGKTNLLEAIHILGSGKSFRTSSSDQLIKDQQNIVADDAVPGLPDDQCFVEGRIEDSTGPFDIGISISKKSRGYFFQKNKVKNLSEFIGRLITVTFVPADLYLVKGAPSLRREFIDKHLFDLKPLVLGSLAKCSKAVKQKHALLMQNPRPEEIRAWNRVIAENGSELIKARREFISSLNIAAEKIHSSFAGNDEKLEVIYKENLQGIDSSEEIFCKLESVLTSEIRQKRVMLGPQKDDLLLYLGSRENKKSDAKYYASQGQCRSIVLSLKLAVVSMIESQRGESPVILLDDMSSELDKERNRLFLEEISKQQRQIFITSTEDRLGYFDVYEKFSINSGIIKGRNTI